MAYVLKSKAVRALKGLIRGSTDATGTTYSPASVCIDRFPLPFTVRWSNQESAWTIWLPDPSKLCMVEGSYETITGVTACQDKAAGWYTVDDASASSTSIYLVVTVSETTSGGTTTTSTTAELSDSPGSGSTGDTVYNLLVASLSSDASTGAKRVKQHLASSVVIGGKADVELDELSIDENTSDEIEIKGWENGTPAWTNSIGKILSGEGGTDEKDEQMICRQSDGTLGFRTIGEVTGGGGGLSGTVSFVADVRYDLSYHQLQQRIDTLDLATGQVTQGQYAMITNGQAVPLSGG